MFVDAFTSAKQQKMKFVVISKKKQKCFTIIYSDGCKM